MGKVVDALRANLRELALSDARSLRELQAELGLTGRGGGARPPAVLGGCATAVPALADGAVAALPGSPIAADGLDGLTVSRLRALCKQSGLRGYSKFTKPQCLAALRGGPVVAPAVLVPGAAGAEISPLEQRLERLEALVVLVAQAVGVPAERIAALLEG